jgi:hypothetical protein
MGIPSDRIVAQHTPGPWSYYLDSEGCYGISHQSEEHEPGDVAHVYIPGAVDPEYDDGNEGLANARLIAAAPALRDALAWAVEWIERYEGEVMPAWREWQQRGRAALDAVRTPAAGTEER